MFAIEVRSGCLPLRVEERVCLASVEERVYLASVTLPRDRFCQFCLFYPLRYGYFHLEVHFRHLPVLLGFGTNIQGGTVPFWQVLVLRFGGKSGLLATFAIPVPNPGATPLAEVTNGQEYPRNGRKWPQSGHFRPQKPLFAISTTQGNGFCHQISSFT